jgi:hypothetical protein
MVSLRKLIETSVILHTVITTSFMVLFYLIGITLVYYGLTGKQPHNYALLLVGSATMHFFMMLHKHLFKI